LDEMVAHVKKPTRSTRAPLSYLAIVWGWFGLYVCFDIRLWGLFDCSKTLVGGEFGF
jgi:hypothetical protein